MTPNYRVGAIPDEPDPADHLVALPLKTTPYAPDKPLRMSLNIVLINVYRPVISKGFEITLSARLDSNVRRVSPFLFVNSAYGDLKHPKAHSHSQNLVFVRG